MQKFKKTFLHLWISLVSVAAFTFGWAFLAHAQKPAPLVQPQAPAITFSQASLEPIPTINDYLKNGDRPVQVFQNPNLTFPRLRARGS